MRRPPTIAGSYRLFEVASAAMKRPLSLPTILIALLALQFTALSPAAFAMDTAMASTTSADCAGAHAGAKDDCPCCPDGLPSYGSCHVLCIAAVAIPPALAPLALHASPSASP